MLDLFDHKILYIKEFLNGQKLFFISIFSIFAIIFKHVFQMRFIKKYANAKKVISFNILDSLLLVCLIYILL